MLTLKLSGEQMAALGVETAEQVEALLNEAADTKLKLNGTLKRNGELSAQVVAFENRLAQIETRVSAIKSFDESQLRAMAKDEAAKESVRLQAEFMAKTGIRPVDTAPAGPSEKPSQRFEDKVAALMNGGLKKGEAITQAVKLFPELHRDFVNRQATI